MNANDEYLCAGEYVLGALEPVDRVEFETGMARNPALRGFVETWERDLAPLLTGAPEAAPPPDALARIERRIATGEAVSGSIRTVLKSDAIWTKFMPGIEKKLLHVDTGQKAQSYLLRFAPGASLPPHDHKIAEECIVLEGAITVADAILSDGDFQLLPAGSRHAEMVSADGAVVHVRGEIDGPAWDLYRFARNIGALFGH